MTALRPPRRARATAALLCALAAAPALAESPRPELVLWHGYTGAEQQALETLAARFNARGSPHLTTLAIPFDAFADKLTAAIGVGKGPDLFVFAHDRLGDWARRGLVEPIQNWADAPTLERFEPSALEALAVPAGSRSLYGLPLAMKSVALVYDAAKVASPPRTLEELEAMARPLTGGGAYGFAMDWASTYTEAGFLHAFGGGLLDASGEPAIDQLGNARALAWVRSMRDAGLLPREISGAMVGSLFNDRKAAMIVAGPWALRDVKPGIDVRVAPLPAGPAGPARPYLGVEALVLSANSRAKRAAFDAMLFLTSDDGARLRLEEAGQPVANRAAWAGARDAALSGFKAQAEVAVPMPSAPAMRHVWTPMDAAIAKAVGQGADPAEALAEAQRRVVAAWQASDRPEPEAERFEGAEQALAAARRLATDPAAVPGPSANEGRILRFAPGPGRFGGVWCVEEGDGAAARLACPAPKELADLADEVVAGRPDASVRWALGRSRVAVAVRAGDGRVAVAVDSARPADMRAAAALAGLLLLSLGGAAFAARRRLRPHLGAYGYVFPAVSGVVVLVFVPFGYGLRLAFFDATPTRQSFVGLANFLDILLARGAGDAHSFYFTFGMTMLWTAVNVALHVTIGLALALVLQDPKLRFKEIYRVLLIVPWAIPNYITALIWKAMFNAEYGLVNHLLGLGTFAWFDRPVTAFLANLATNVWLGFPFMMVTALGALQSIPRELYEAAEVDGAGRLAKFRHVTLPLLRPALVPAIILGTIWTFNLSFNVIYLVSGGAPDGATDILVTQAFRYAFEQYRYGYAAAYAALIFLMLLAYTLVTNRITRATEGASA